MQGSVGEIRTNQEYFSLKNEKKSRAASVKQNLLVLVKKECILQSNFKKSLDLDLKSLGLPHWA